MCQEDLPDGTGTELGYGIGGRTCAGIDDRQPVIGSKSVNVAAITEQP